MDINAYDFMDIIYHLPACLPACQLACLIYHLSI